MNVPISETGMVIAGMERAPPVLQEHVDDDDDQRDGLQKGDEHVAYGFTDDCRGIEGHGCLDPRREIFGEPQQLRLCGLVHIEARWRLEAG